MNRIAEGQMKNSEGITNWLSKDHSSAAAALKRACDTPNEYQFEMFQGKAGFDAIRQDWNQITHLLDNLRFFHRLEWYESYLKALAEGDSPVFFALVRQQGSPLGVIPLVRATRKVAGLRLRSLELIHHPHMPLSDGVFARSDFNQALIHGLIAYLREQSEIGVDVLFLPNLLEDACIQNALKGAPFGWLISTAHRRCNYLPCISYDQLSAKFSKNFRGSLRKARNKLASLPGVEYICARQQPELGWALEEFLDVEASGWKGAMGERSAIKLDIRLTNFYRSLSETFSRIGACEISLLRADGHCLAGQFSLVVEDTSYLLKIGYNESYAHVAPGNMLLEHTLRRYWQEGVVKYLNLVTDAPWHASWNPLSYPVSNTYVFNTMPAGLAAFALLHCKRYLRSKYKAAKNRWLSKGHRPNNGLGNAKRTKEDAHDYHDLASRRKRTNRENWWMQRTFGVSL